jgi:hypothetical protein
MMSLETGRHLRSPAAHEDSDAARQERLAFLAYFAEACVGSPRLMRSGDLRYSWLWDRTPVHDAIVSL